MLHQISWLSKSDFRYKMMPIISNDRCYEMMTPIMMMKCFSYEMIAMIISNDDDNILNDIKFNDTI